MKRPRIRGVVFDAVGTLMHPDPPAAVAYAQAAAVRGWTIPAEECGRRFRAAFEAEEIHDMLPEQGPFARRPTGAERERRRWERIVHAVFADLPPEELAPLFTRLWSHFAAPENWRAAAGVADLWRTLRASGRTPAIASNFDFRLHRAVECLQLPQHRAPVFSCAELEWAKPSRDFYLGVADRLRLAPEELLFVGDDSLHDGTGPRAAGCWSVVLGEPSRELEIPQIPDLCQLPEWLELHMEAPPPRSGKVGDETD